MDIAEIKTFFDEFRAIPSKRIEEALNLVSGIAMASGNREFVIALLNPGSGFEEVYSELAETARRTELLDTEKTLSALEDCKDILHKAHTFYRYKKEASSLLTPFDFMSTAVDSMGDKNSIFFPIMLMLMGMGTSRCNDGHFPGQETASV